MKQVAEAIKHIGATSGTNDKLMLLKKYADVPGLKDILKFIYNPYCKTGISDAKLKAPTTLTVVSRMEWSQAIKYFESHQTGSMHDVAVALNFILWTKQTYGNDAASVAYAMVTQNLKIGITATSLNKVYGSDFIPKTGCMLGTLLGDVGEARVKWPCIVTEKLDGIRRILVKENGVCRFYSRSGHEDTGLIEIAAEAKYLPDNYMYDGELLAKGNFKDSIALRQATNSIANSKGTKTGLTFNVFDMVPVDEFYRGISKHTALQRKILLGATLKDESIQLIDKDWAVHIVAFGVEQDLKHIVPVPILGMVPSLPFVEPIVEEIWARGGEGVMLNVATAPYEVKRSKNLLKIKHTEDYMLPVADMVEGSGKYEDAMGALVLVYKNKLGVESLVSVGSGFTDAQRVEIWNNPDKYIGRMVEIETFGESTNVAGVTSLNCPIFKRFVGVVE